MAKLTWDTDREYEIGVDRGIFFPQDGPAEVWNGLVSVEEQPELVGNRTRYMDGIKLDRPNREATFAATVTALDQPPSFLLHPRIPFGFSYRVMTAKAYKVHIVYNAMAKRTNRSYVQDDTTPVQFDLTTRPTPVFEAAATSHLVVDAGVATAAALSKFEALLYGSDDNDSLLPTPQQIVDIFEADPLIKVIDNGDGTFTVDGPDDLVHMVDLTEFEVISPTAVYLDGESYTVRSF